MNEPHARAPQLPADPALWLNTGGKAVSLSDMKGCVVLLYFWAYSSINCLHVLPDMRQLQAKYADRPFMLIGVHSGRYDNEKDKENIRSAILRHDIRYPVVCDDDHQVGQAYDVHAWPTFVVLDPDGFYIGSLAGEGRREALDSCIGKLLSATKTGARNAPEPRRFLFLNHVPSPTPFCVIPANSWPTRFRNACSSPIRPTIAW